MPDILDLLVTLQELYTRALVCAADMEKLAREIKAFREQQAARMIGEEDKKVDNV